jgi:ABC-type Fe3+-hydroxamate transport system substrate-binding protein
LKPDLVIANKEENVKEQIEALQKFTKVHVSDVANLADAKNMILQVGALLGRQLQAGSLVQELKINFQNLK